MFLERKDELAAAITDVMYGDEPTVTMQYGEAGRVKCRQDMR